MKMGKKEVQVFSIAIILASAREFRSSAKFSITLIRSPDHVGPVNVSVNDTVVAKNIDANQKNKLVLPKTTPSSLLNGCIRICATGMTPPEPQIYTDI